MLARALEALEEVDAGESAFVSGPLATSPDGAAEVFVTLVTYARAHHINIITSLHLGGESIADLPGHDDNTRYHALCIFTRYGAVHVPQAEVLPQSFLLNADEPIGAYDRLNRVTLDLDGELVPTLFFLGADPALLSRFMPSDLASQLLVAVGAFVAGGESKATRLMKLALDAGVGQTSLVASSFLGSNMATALEHQHEQVLQGAVEKPLEAWPQPRALRLAVHIYDDADALTAEALLELPHHGRVTVARSRWDAPVAANRYPVTVVL